MIAGAMQDKRLARITLGFSLKVFLNTRHAPRVISLRRKAYPSNPLPFIYRGDYLLRVSLKRGPQVGTCAFDLTTGIPRTQGPMIRILLD